MAHEFIIERLIGKMVADGSTDVPGRAGIKAGRPPIPPPPTDLGLSSTPPGAGARGEPLVNVECEVNLSELTDKCVANHSDWPSGGAIVSG